MNRYWTVALFLIVVGCGPQVDVYSYEPGHDQVLFLYSAVLPTQVFYREGADSVRWTATASTSLESPPPVSGPWTTRRQDWVVIGGPIGIERRPCEADALPLQRLASRLSISVCRVGSEECCTASGKRLVGSGRQCRVPTEWTSPLAEGLCFDAGI